LRLHQGKACLLPATEYVRASGGGDPPVLFGPYPDDDELKKSLAKLGRIESIKRLAGTGSGGEDVKVDVEILLLQGKTDKKGTPLKRASDGMTVHEGDYIGLRLHNPNRFPVDVTVLYLTSDYG